MVIIWSHSAITDLESLRYFISLDSTIMSEKVARTIIDTINKQLSIFPESGRIGIVDSTRELVLAKLPYFVSYKYQNDTVTILRVYHTSRLWPLN